MTLRYATKSTRTTFYRSRSISCRNDAPGEREHAHQQLGGSVPQEDWAKVVQLIEVTPDKKVAWALRDWDALGPASSTQLLDQAGAVEKRELQR